MTATIEFVRPRRGAPPTVPVRADVPVDAPPPVPRAVPVGVLTRLMPAVTLLATAGMVAVLVRSGSGVARNPMFLVFPIMLAASAVTTISQSGGGRQRAAELNADRARYLDYLRALADQLTKDAGVQRDWLLWWHPEPDALWTLIGTGRMWERRRGAADFGRLRIGLGATPSASRPVQQPTASAAEADPVTTAAVVRFLRAHSSVSGAPSTVGMVGSTAITIDGAGADVRALVRALICQLAVLHSPADVALVAALGHAEAGHWDWLKWLPHHQDGSAVDEGGPLRMIYPGLGDALADARAGRHVVVIVDGVAIGDAQRLVDRSDTTVLEIGCTGAAVAQRSGTRIRLTSTRLVATSPDGVEIVASPDLMTPLDAQTCARRLAGFRAGGGDHDGAVGSWCELMGIPDVARAHPNTLWDRIDGHRLRVPIGVSEHGEAVDLDIKEAAERGMGPHGLCVGATGSGKSELLRTVALGMVARHSPDVLNLILVDFKGGATFLGLNRTNHVSAVITNLADEAHLVERLRDALTGEIIRRQQTLRTAGNLASVVDYDRARRAGRPLAPLPSLFVIVDEFSELLNQHPDFIDVFVAIGRLGRSLGIHLLLASQRLDEGRLRGLDAHLSYRICLKTLSAGESRSAIGVPDAYQLPASPGAAYLKVGADEAVRFQTAFVSGSIGLEQPDRPCVDVPAEPRLFTAAPMGRVLHPGVRDGAADRSLLDTVLGALAGHGPAAHQVWLPPLPHSPTLDAVLAEFRTADDLLVPIGVVDRVVEQRRVPMMVDLSGAAGHVAVVGAPQSGKSTALRTLVTALALTHDAHRVQVYCLDFGGGALASLAGLPQVGSVAGRLEVDLARRTVTEVAAVLRRREQRFRDLGVASIADYRRRQIDTASAGRGDPFGDVFLVVDGWNVLRQEFDELESVITSVAAEGLSFGVHVVLTASRWADIRPALKDQIGTRIELRLGDPADSEIDRKRSRQVPQGVPGRGLAPDGMPLVIAMPPPEGSATARGLGGAGGRRAPAIRLLPALVDHDDLVRDAPRAVYGGLIIGVDETRLATIAVDFAQQQHLLILGDAHCGKTTALRVLCREIARTTSAQLFLVDPRRGLLGETEPERLAGYAGSPAAVEGQLVDLMAELRARLPGPEVTAHQLRTRSWWSGPDVYLVADDYDLVATAAGNPLTPILDLLPHAGDIGLHMLVARRSGGAARALYEPVLAAIRDLGAIGLQMSASGDEGALLGGVRPRPLPPGRAVLTTRMDGERVIQVAWRGPQ